MTLTSVPKPRSSYKAGKTNNFEANSWLFMRGSGLLLVVLVIGHLFVNLWMGEGIHRIDFAFVAGKLSDPFWQWYDFALLVLALVHGTNGMRTIVNDYVAKASVRRILHTALIASTAVLLVLGTLVLFTFDPCPAGADP